MTIRPRTWQTKRGEERTKYVVTLPDPKRPGRSIQVGTCRTKKEAEALELKKKREIQDGIFVANSATVTFSRAAEAWIKEKERLNEAPRLRKRYHDDLAHHILPALGHLKLTEVTSQRVQDWINEMAGAKNLFTLRGTPRRTGDGYARATMARWRNIIRQVLNYATQREPQWVAINVLKDKQVRLPKRPARQPYILTDEEAVRILTAVWACDPHQKGETHRALIVLYWLAMRRGELAGLCWEAIDFDRHVIIVRTKRIERGNEALPGTKTGEDVIRVIPIVDKLYVVLVWYRSMTKDPTGLVLRGRNGRLLGLTDISSHHHDTVMARAGLAKPMLDKDGKPVLDRRGKAKVLSKCTFHDLRHYVISRVLRGGGSLKATQTLAGHKDGQITLNRYGHLMPHDETLLRALDQMTHDVFAPALGLPATAPRLLPAPSPAPAAPVEVIPPQVPAVVNGQTSTIIEAPLPPTPANLAAQKEAWLREMRRQGYSYAEMAVELGVSEETVRRYLKSTAEERAARNRKRTDEQRARQGLSAYTTAAERAQLANRDAETRERLRAIVAAGVISQNAFAKQAGVTQATVNRFFHGVTGLGTRTRPGIEATLGAIEAGHDRYTTCRT